MSSSVRVLALAAFLVLLVAACGSDGSGVGSPGNGEVDTPTDGGSSDAESTDGGLADDVTGIADGEEPIDVSDEGDDVTDGPETSGLPEDGVILCDPQRDDECPEGPCVTFDAAFDQGLCGTFCVTDADCPGSFRCVRITVGADVETACLPIDFCLDQDGDGYGFGPGCLGPDCDDSDPDVYFGAPSLCDGKDNNCNGLIDDNPIGTAEDCDTGFPGICAEGRRQCSFGTWECTPRREPAEFESCNGLDTTCDGLVDAIRDDDGNEVPLTRQCYDGPSGTEGVGQCRAGVRTCVNGEFGSCVGQVLPAEAEVCNGVDSTCNGLVDDSPVDVGQECDTGLVGLCGVGRWECREGGRVCVAINRPAEVESCSGQDDTCDGLVDMVLDEEGSPVALTEPCYTGPAGTEGVGICQAGVRTCTGGEWSSCAGEVLPREETCNGLDDNCDGLVDNANAAGARLSEPCYEGEDGTEGVGECRGGTRFCVDGEYGECVGQVLPAPVEVCDGRDNTCDGLVDQTAPGVALTRPCYDGPSGTIGVGVCTGGTQTCQAGEYGTCAGQVLPGVEQCNGRDDNCDGTVDSGAPGGGIPCNSGLPGVCAAGVTTCAGGSIQCEASVQPGERVERCNGLDENCDGTVDTGFVGLGQPCFVGEGLCRRAGLNICNPADDMAQPVCDASPGEPQTEVCDYQDTNCDGTIDTGFRNAQGIYDGVSNCGACGVNCNNLWPGGPEQYNVIPRCTVSAGVAQCGFDCMPGFVDADGVAENGCELQPDSGAVYVARPVSGGQDTSGCGAWDSPCATIAHGLARTSASRPRVRVGDGVFRESVVLPNGRSLLGGHSSVNWRRDPEVFVSLINGVGGSGPDRVAVRIEGVSSATELSGFTIQSENAPAGGNSIGVYVRNANEALIIQDNQVLPGRGGNGSAGQAGQAGQNGASGSSGALRTVGNTCSVTRPIPGAGGSRTCPNLRAGGTMNVSGGTGGAATCPSSGTRTGSGANGSGTSPGSGGLGPGHFVASGSNCSVNTNLGVDAIPGTAGGIGNDGTGGSRSGSAGSVSGGQWRGAGGGSGQAGLPGSGGGGGSAAAGLDDPGFTPRYYFGATGGGGGSGGCAGSAGGGGTAGGGSFAIFITQSSSTAASNMPVVRRNTLTRGSGGDGGAGGTGGGGGDGTSGGAGGPSASTLEQFFFDFCMLAGGAGGGGGRGGHGGGGAGGNGGASWDIYVHNGAARGAYTNNNIFAVPESTNTGGSGGTGGNSSNTSVGIGQSGNAGASGHIRVD